MAATSILADIETVLATGSAERQATMLRRVTDLFLAGVDVYSSEQIDVFDGVIMRLADRIETRARAELARRLAPVENAPPLIVRDLAHDESIEVAEPIISQSSQLTDEDLLDIAKNNSQPRLLAIAKRPIVSETISDVLVASGDRDVMLSVARNEGARFSDAGYGTLVNRSIDDEVLAVCVGMRKDIPREHFHALVSKASRVVFEKLSAANPSAVSEVQRVIAGITGQEAPKVEEKTAPLPIKKGEHKSTDHAVYLLAAAGNVAETITALSALCRAPAELVGKVLNDTHGDNDFVLLLARAAGLSWPTAKQICIMRKGEAGVAALDINAAQRSFERLQPETAQRVIRFYNERHAAVANFGQLEQQMRAPRFGGAR